MKIIHDDGYSNKERLMYKTIVYCNVVQSLYTIIKAMKMLSIHYESETVSIEASNFIAFVRSMYSIERNYTLIINYKFYY